jgi:Tfp pilus assembly protein PilO
MSDRRMWLSVIGGGVLLAGTFGGLIYYQNEDIEMTREEAGNLRTEIAAARTLIEGTSALEREVIVLREVSDVIKGILPDESDVNNLVRTFQEYSGESEVRITSLKKKQNPVVGQETSFDKVAYTLSLAGDAFQLLSFLDNLESHSRFMRIPSFKVSAAQRNQLTPRGGGSHKVQLDVETYVYDDQNTTAPVRIEGYERKRDLLLGEINRRSQALTVATYDYRGIRGRRDPWIDPRIPVLGDGESALTVQEQMDIVQALVEKTRGVLTKWEETQNAQNVIVEMMARAALEESLVEMEEEIRRLQNEGSIRYIASSRRLQIEVVDVLADLRSSLISSEAGRGPSEDTLREVLQTMEHHMAAGEYEMMLEAFAVVEDRLELAQTDPLRLPFVERLRRLAEMSRTVSDFEKLEIVVTGTAIMEGAPPAILINGEALGVGDMLDNEIIIRAIAKNEVEFLFRGVILEKRF